MLGFRTAAVVPPCPCCATVLLQVRTAFATELQQRTELEVFLRQCVEDVRQDIARKRGDTTDRSEGTVPPSRLRHRCCVCPVTFGAALCVRVVAHRPARARWG